MKTTNTYGAALIDLMGSDLTVVNAARVSFDKSHEAFEFPDDMKLIAYLARNGHWTPFAHPHLSFRVSAPIFVARQLQKHQVGLTWNEVSRRYVDSEPAIYVPDKGTWRLKADNVKQGSSDEYFYGTPYIEGRTNAQGKKVGATPFSVFHDAVKLYNSMLDQGICPEQARMVLPQSMITEWVWTGSLAAFARVVNQRLDPHAQRECRPVAEDIAKALSDNFPVSWEALKIVEDKS
jgi:thymidylate synthase (FAD)